MSRTQVDSLRGFACLLLVFYHVVGADPSSGLELEHGWLRDINDLLAYLRMPLFTVLSGYVYAARPCMNGFPDFMKGKIKRLLAPLVVVGSLFYVMQLKFAPPSAPLVWSELLFRPYAHFWYLESLFLIFALVAGLDCLGALNGWRRLVMLIAVACLASWNSPDIPWFGVNGALYLLPYFSLGLALRREGFHSEGSWPLALVFFAGGCVCVAFFCAPGVVERQTVAGTIASLLFGLAVFSVRVESLFLARIGGYSYTIYLYHVFFSAGTRIFMSGALGETHLWVLCVTGLVAGVSGPILFHLCVPRLPWLRRGFLGLSATKG